MGKAKSPAEVFSPGEFISDELQARGWKQEDLARVLGRPLKTVNELIRGKKAITATTALELASAFGTSAQFWLNLESAYRLSLLSSIENDVGRRARVHSLVPVRELMTRGWLRKTPPRDLVGLEQAVCEFLSIRTIRDDPDVRFAARVALRGEQDRRAQVAWVCRVRSLAQGMKAARFSSALLQKAAAALPRLSGDPDAAPELPQKLAAAGVRLLFVPALASSKIDGAAVWLDGRCPVVALSLRRDRIDYFWFTLMHELAHVVRKHGSRGDIVDSSLVGQDRMAADHRCREDAQADRLASDWLIPPPAFKKLAGLARRTRGRFSRTQIIAFANQVGVHPGIIVGRLQFEGWLPWTHMRNLLTGVRETLASRGMVDTIPEPVVG